MCLTGTPKLIRVTEAPKLERGAPAPPSVIRAWRAWTYDSLGDRLRSTYKTEAVWQPGKPMDAHGAITTKSGAIGVHAVKKLSDINLIAGFRIAEPRAVVGEVLLWGDIAEHDNGYRAEHAYPCRLWTNNYFATAKLRDTYDVAVEIKSVNDLMSKHPKGR